MKIKTLHSFYFAFNGNPPHDLDWNAVLKRALDRVGHSWRADGLPSPNAMESNSSSPIADDKMFWNAGSKFGYDPRTGPNGRTPHYRATIIDFSGDPVIGSGRLLVCIDPELHYEDDAFSLLLPGNWTRLPDPESGTYMSFRHEPNGDTLFVQCPSLETETTTEWAHSPQRRKEVFGKLFDREADIARKKLSPGDPFQINDIIDDSGILSRSYIGLAKARGRMFTGYLANKGQDIVQLDLLSGTTNPKAHFDLATNIFADALRFK